MISEIPQLTIDAMNAADATRQTITKGPNMDSALLLGHDSDWWNGVMLWSLIAAAFVAALVAAATTGVVVVTKRENAAAKLRIATLENSTAEARAEAERLKSLVNWREVNADTLTQLITDLAALKGSVTFAYVQNDPEVINFTALLQKVFVAANNNGGDWQSWCAAANVHKS